MVLLRLQGGRDVKEFERLYAERTGFV